MKIVSEILDDVTLLTLNGDLDGRGNQQLDKALKDLIRSGNYKVILDISAIRFIGNQTISILLSNLKEFRAGNGNIKFLNPQRPVLQHLKNNRITEMFTFYNSRAEALHSFKNEYAGNGSSYGGENQASPKPHKPAQPSPDLERRFATGEILYTNSCMIASLIKILEAKGALTPEESRDLLNPDNLPMKGDPQ